MCRGRGPPCQNLVTCRRRTLAFSLFQLRQLRPTCGWRRPSRRPCEREDTVSKSIAVLAVCILILVPMTLGGQQPDNSAGTKMHVLKPTPKTVVWGYFDGASKPVLKIKSGETVEVQTLLAGTPEVL